MISNQWWDPTLYGWPRGVLLTFEVGMIDGQVIGIKSEARSLSEGTLLGLQYHPHASDPSISRVRAEVSINLASAIRYAREPFPSV
jgi:hypothetical protein